MVMVEPYWCKAQDDDGGITQVVKEGAKEFDAVILDRKTHVTISLGRR